MFTEKLKETEWLKHEILLPGDNLLVGFSVRYDWFDAISVKLSKQLKISKSFWLSRWLHIEEKSIAIS